MCAGVQGWSGIFFRARGHKYPARTPVLVLVAEKVRKILREKPDVIAREHALVGNLRETRSRGDDIVCPRWRARLARPRARLAVPAMSFPEQTTAPAGQTSTWREPASTPGEITRTSGEPARAPGQAGAHARGGGEPALRAGEDA
jgi:hypothetical protein